MNLFVTTDGSIRSLHILPHAAALSAATGWPLIFARILDPLTDLHDQRDLTVEAAIKHVSERWIEAMREQLAAAHTDGQPIVVRQMHGEDTATAILRAAHDSEAAIIAMDTRGNGVLKHTLIGSVAMATVGHSALPVLLTGPNASPAACRADGYRVVATTDGSPASLAVLAALEPLLGTGRLDATLFRLCWPGLPGPECETTLAELRGRLPHPERIATTVQQKTLVSGAAPAIIATAEALRANAIALATHGHSAAYHLFGGSTALGVLEQSPLPVILCRAHKP